VFSTGFHTPARAEVYFSMLDCATRPHAAGDLRATHGDLIALSGIALGRDHDLLTKHRRIVAARESGDEREHQFTTRSRC
jgi:hypothetical protein